MRLNKRFRTFCVLLVCQIALLPAGCWLIMKVLEPNYPNLDVDCFEPRYSLSVDQVDLRAKTEGRQREKLNIYALQGSLLIASINFVFGHIHNPAFCPDHTLLLFSENGPTTHEVTIVRACDMITGQQKFAIKDLSAIRAISFSSDGRFFTLQFSYEAERQYSTTTGKRVD